MYVYKLTLRTTRRMEKELDLRFYLIWRIHVILAKHAQKLMHILEHNRMYQQSRTGYLGAAQRLAALEKELEDARAAKADKPAPLAKERGLRKVKDIQADISAAKADRAMFAEAMDAVRESLGLTEYGLQEHAKVQQHKYAKHLQSQEVQKEATRVWRGVEKVLFGNGKKLRIPKLNDIRSICGKQKGTGIRFLLHEGKLIWNGLEVPCDMKPFDGAILPKSGYEAIALGECFSYCEVVRLPFPQGYRYYLHVYMQGDAPNPAPQAPDKASGIDPGVSTMAAVSETGDCALEELAPDIRRYNRVIKKLSTQLEAERRRSNPDNYLPDGRIRKGKKAWARTKKYNCLEMLLRSWYRKRSAYVRTAHGTLANRILEAGRHILAEKMQYSALARRSRKKAERQEKESTVTKKDGTAAKVRKFKRKKRFGRSLNNRSPALFLKILEGKALRAGGSYTEVDTRELKASQYDHVKDGYIKVGLSCRMKEVGGHKVQRDLYSAFIIVNVSPDLASPDRQKCLAGFGAFIEKHDQLIQEIITKKPVRPACFGF